MILLYSYSYSYYSYTMIICYDDSHTNNNNHSNDYVNNKFVIMGLILWVTKILATNVLQLENIYVQDPR